MIQINEQILSKVTRDEYWFLSHLCNFIGKNNEAWPSNATMSERTGMGLTTVKKVRKGLEVKGIIQVTRRKSDNGKTNKSNLYRLTTDLLSVYTLAGKNAVKEEGSSGRSPDDRGVGRQTTGGRSPDDRGRSPSVQEVLPNEVLPIEVGRGESTREPEKIEITYDHSEADKIDDAFSPSPEKEKSSAKKENEQDGPLTPETARRRDEFLSRQRAASVRALGSMPPTPDEPAQAATPARIHDMTNSILKDLETEWGQRQLQIAHARARIGDAKCENMYAAVYRYYEHNCIERRRPMRTDIIPNLGGYIRKQIEKEAREAQNKNNHGKFNRATRTNQPAVTDDCVVRVANQLDYERVHGTSPLGF